MISNPNDLNDPIIQTLEEPINRNSDNSHIEQYISSFERTLGFSNNEQLYPTSDELHLDRVQPQGEQQITEANNVNFKQQSCLQNNDHIYTHEFDQFLLNAIEPIEELEKVLNTPSIFNEAEELRHEMTNVNYQQLEPDQHRSSPTSNTNGKRSLGCGSPHVEIVEQPAKCPVRFRYPSESHKAGTIPGVNSTANKKTYPSIRIRNFTGRAVVVVSCVTKDEPYLAHPYSIVGNGCKDDGVCTVKCQGETVVNFPSIGIHRVKRSEIKGSLEMRESIRVDPFQNGFKHRDCKRSIDLSAVRLCFQVFIESSTPEVYNIALPPIVSEPIYDKKADSTLVIEKISHCSAPANGGRDIILLCNKVNEDVCVRFFEERNGIETWETNVELEPTDIHRKVAISFRSPKYKDENILQPVMCKIQLKRTSDEEVSEPRAFQFLPCVRDEETLKRKRQKLEWAQLNYRALSHNRGPTCTEYDPQNSQQNQQFQYRNS